MNLSTHCELWPNHEQPPQKEIRSSCLEPKLNPGTEFSGYHFLDRYISQKM